MKISFSIVAALFDYSMKVHEVQKVQYWLRLLEKTNEMLTLAKEENDNITVINPKKLLIRHIPVLVLIYLNLIN